MDSVLRQSKAMCPFMKKATAASLRAMTTTAAAASARPAVSPCGGTISKLQTLARRCPVMGKAMAVQSARLKHTASFPAVAGVAAGRSVSTFSATSVHGKTTKAKLHTGRGHEARAVEGNLFREKGE